MNCFSIRFCFYWGQFVCVRVSYFVFSVFPLCYCLVVSTSAIDCLERLVSEMTGYVSSGMLNPTHSLSHSLPPTCRLLAASDQNDFMGSLSVFLIFHAHCLFCVNVFVSLILLFLISCSRLIWLLLSSCLLAVVEVVEVFHV